MAHILIIHTRFHPVEPVLRLGNIVILHATPSLSLLKEYLLRTGWSVRDRTDPSTGMVMSVAEHDFFSESMHYCKPTYYYLGYDRDADLRQGIINLARMEGRTYRDMESVVSNVFERPLHGFTCRRCGRCCRNTSDAFQGLVWTKPIETSTISNNPVD